MRVHANKSDSSLRAGSLLGLRRSRSQLRRSCARPQKRACLQARATVDSNSSQSAGEFPRAHGCRRERMRVAEGARKSPKTHESCRESTRVTESATDIPAKREFELPSPVGKLRAD